MRLFTQLEQEDFGKLLAFQGPEKQVKLVMHSLTAKLTDVSEVILIDTNNACRLQYFGSAIDKIQVATPFTVEELLMTIKRLRHTIREQRVVVITSLDHCFLDPQLDEYDALFFLYEVMAELAVLTEGSELMTIVGLSEATNERLAKLHRCVQPRVHFLTHL